MGTVSKLAQLAVYEESVAYTTSTEAFDRDGLAC